MFAKVVFIVVVPCSNLVLGLPTGPRTGRFLSSNEVRQSQPSLPTWEVFQCAYEIGSAAKLTAYHTDIAFCPVGTPTSSLPSASEAPEFLRTNGCIEMIWDGRNDGAIYTSVGNDVGKWPQGAEHPLQPEMTYKGRASVELESLAREMQTCGTWGGQDWRDFNKDTYHFTKHNCNSFSHQVYKYLKLGGLDLTYRKESLLDNSILYAVASAGLYVSASAEARENIKRVVDAPIQKSTRCERELEEMARFDSPVRYSLCGFGLCGM